MIVFGNPMALLGLAGIAVPIIIHLLTRDRVRKVAFSSLRFFANASKHVLRKKRFSELLLITLRALACALLALVFARPVFRSGDSADPSAIHARKARVVAVDISGSMTRSGGDDALRNHVLQALAGLRSGADAAALVAFDETARVVAPLSTDIDSVVAAVGEIEIGHGATDLVGALRESADALGNARAGSSEIVLVSDLQRAGWEGFKGDWKLPSTVELALRPVLPDDGVANLAITDAAYPDSLVIDNVPRNVVVRVANHSPVAAENVQVVLRVNDETAGEKTVLVPEGATVAVRFRHVFVNPGDNLATVTVLAEDVDPADNQFFFNTRVIPRIPILVIAPPTTGAVFGPRFFLETALAPTADSPFEAKAVSLAEVTPEHVEAAAVAILADVPSVPSGVRDALGRLLDRGGGVLFLPGSNVRPETFASCFGELLPCRLRGVAVKQTGDGRPTETGLTKIDYTHTIFQVFLRPHHGDFGSLKFSRYWDVTGSQLSRVLARYEDGRPAVLEREVGAGVSLAWLSPVDMAWGNLPLRAIYLPLLHQTVRYLALRTERPTHHVVGDALPVAEGLTVTGPDREVVPPGDSTAVTPGFYLVQPAQGDAYHLAVNRAFSEADSRLVDAEEIAASLERDTAESATSAAVAGFAAGTGQGGALWSSALAALVLLLLVELFVGNRTVRH